MDAGIGITGAEVVRFDFKDDGTFQLAGTPWVVYDTYYTAFYYWNWHIRVHWGQVSSNHILLPEHTIHLYYYVLFSHRINYSICYIIKTSQKHVRPYKVEYKTDITSIFLVWNAWIVDSWINL